MFSASGFCSWERDGYVNRADGIFLGALFFTICSESDGFYKNPTALVKKLDAEYWFL